MCIISLAVKGYFKEVARKYLAFKTFSSRLSMRENKKKFRKYKLLMVSMLTKIFFIFRDIINKYERKIFFRRKVQGDTNISTVKTERSTNIFGKEIQLSFYRVYNIIVQ